jgi:hypothetical protein
MATIIHDILRQHHQHHQHHLAEAFEAATDFHLRIENPPYLPLVIERHGDEVSVAHYFTQNGDAMRDPEMTFRLPDWTPTSITQDPLGHYACIGDWPEGSRQRARLVADLTSFAGAWARNIQAQGFACGGEVKVSSLTHQSLLARDARTEAQGDSASDAHLETLYEDRFVSDYEDYEPSPYDGTYSEE